MRQVQKNWFGSAIGKAMNPDQAYGLQCVDVTDHYAEAIFPGVPWQTSVGGVNGAKDLLRVANRNYWEVINNEPGNPNQLPAQGDVLVWGGTSYNPYGHTAVADKVHGGGSWVLQQNSNGLANQAVHRSYVPYYGIGTGALTGWLRPRGDRMPGDAAPSVPGAKLLTVTANVAIVRTSPRVEAGNVAPAYPAGITKGNKVAAVGYVAGQDPYPNDGSTDDAWIKTISGYYIWANALGNDLSGLAKV